MSQFDCVAALRDGTKCVHKVLINRTFDESEYVISAIPALAAKQSLADTVLAAKSIFSRTFTIKKARNCSFCNKHRTSQTLFGIEKSQSGNC